MWIVATNHGEWTSSFSYSLLIDPENIKAILCSSGERVDRLYATGPWSVDRRWAIEIVAESSIACAHLSWPFRKDGTPCFVNHFAQTSLARSTLWCVALSWVKAPDKIHAVAQMWNHRYEAVQPWRATSPVRKTSIPDFGLLCFYYRLQENSSPPFCAHSSS